VNTIEPKIRIVWKEKRQNQIRGGSVGFSDFMAEKNEDDANGNGG